MELQGKTNSINILSDISLDREGNISGSLLHIAVYIFLEHAKQLCNYGLSVGQVMEAKVPSVLLIICTELLKTLLIIAWSQVTRQRLVGKGVSFKFALPATCYLITNLFYLHALQFTTPPVWMIMIQSRTLYTALAYKIIFNRSITVLQILGCVLITISIPLISISESFESKYLDIRLIVLSQISALLSTCASLCVEIFLKNDQRSYLEQQLWLYLFGILLSTLALFPSKDYEGVLSFLQSSVRNRHVTPLFPLTVISSSLAGLCVPRILKSLDNVVKDYLMAFNNILLAVFVHLLFPNNFPLNGFHVISLSVLLAGVTLYEMKPRQNNTNQKFQDVESLN